MNNDPKHFIIIDAAMLDSQSLIHERLKWPDQLLPCGLIFRTRRAANLYIKELEKTLGYPPQRKYLQVLQVLAPKEEWKQQPLI